LTKSEQNFQYFMKSKNLWQYLRNLAFLDFYIFVRFFKVLMSKFAIQTNMDLATLVKDAF